MIDIDRARELEDDKHINYENTYTQEEYSELEDKISNLEGDNEALHDKIDIVRGIILQFKKDVLEYEKGGINCRVVSTGLIGEKIKEVLKELE